MESIITVTGSYGTLYVCKTTGKVVKYDNGGDSNEYSDISVIDLAEFKNTYGVVEDADILDVGYWTTDGRYEPPAPEWGKQRRGRPVADLRRVAGAGKPSTHQTYQVLLCRNKREIVTVTVDAVDDVFANNKALAMVGNHGEKIGGWVCPDEGWEVTVAAIELIAVL